LVVRRQQSLKGKLVLRKINWKISLIGWIRTQD